MIQCPTIVARTPSVTPVGPIHSAGDVSPVKVSSPAVKVSTVVIPEVQDTEEYVEENLSLDDVEREMIRKALERHHGKRKNAAGDLKISERTLYRKIKEYGLE